MLEAVARRKAHWLFNSKSHESFSGRRRPQEDMVTSAVFGSIKLLPLEDRLTALRVVLGPSTIANIQFPWEADLDIRLWPSLSGIKDRRRVEPDVVISHQRRSVIVEVKWHAKLSDRQLEIQKQAVEKENADEPTKVVGIILLGEATLPVGVDTELTFKRSWRDVSAELQAEGNNSHTSPSMKSWTNIMRGFLQETDMGRSFSGLPKLRDPRRAKYIFQSGREA